ncbi:MAG: helix-turn-helix transcriptional regulator [Alphaproteobacteria bacterium]|nr:helix-turn-helix transcriptional regulator [Alphaproteobacteria bacterium]
MTDCSYLPRDEAAAGRSRSRSSAIGRVVAHIEENYAEPLPLAELAQLADVSLYRFVTLFRQEVGMPPHRYLCHVRVREAMALLRSGLPPAHAASEAGFFDQSHLARHFKRVCGMTPGQYATETARP